MKIAAAGVSALAVAFLSAAHDRPSAASPPGIITFTKNVAPILQQKCQVCHQPNSIGPMPLLTYEDAEEYATKIRSRVRARVMPPWHIDRTVGIRDYKNDRSLTDEQVGTLVRWVDAGAPRGDA